MGQFPRGHLAYLARVQRRRREEVSFLFPFGIIRERNIFPLSLPPPLLFFQKWSSQFNLIERFFYMVGAKKRSKLPALAGGTIHFYDSTSPLPLVK